MVRQSSGFCYLLLSIAFISRPEAALAYRPLVAEDAGVAGRGVPQLEVSWDPLRWGNGDREDLWLFVPIYGITDRTEVSLEIPYMFHHPEGGEQQRGLGDVNVVGKYLFLKEGRRRPAFAAKGVVKTSSGDDKKGHGSGDVDYSAVGVFSKGAGDLVWHAMLGYTMVGDNGNPNLRGTYLYGAALDYGLTDAFHIAAEIAGNRHPDRKSPADPLAGALGLIYKISETVILDSAVRHGYNSAVPEWSATLGMSLTGVLPD